MIHIADRNGNVDSVYNTLLRFIDSSKIDIVVVSWLDGFVFNDELLKVKDYVLICYMEYGWNVQLSHTQIWGLNTHEHEKFNTDEWRKFDEWVANNPPRLTLKRELLKQDVSYYLKAIDYPCTLPKYEVVSESQFNARPLDFFFYWGRSSEYRVQLHGDIWKGASKYGYNVCDNLYFFDAFMRNESGRKVVTLNIPHYVRTDISHLMAINSASKISIAPYGAGRKTFRHLESSTNAVMLMYEDRLSWAYEWEHGVNCLKCEPTKELETIYDYFNQKDLYDIYRNGVETADKYRVQNYLNNYIQPLIDKL